MDLRPYNLSQDQLVRAAELAVSGLICYQPFIFSDNLITGAGYEFAKVKEGAGMIYCPQLPPSTTTYKNAKRHLIDPAILDEFRNYNDSLRVLYESMLDLIVEKVGDPRDLTYADVGSCTGYFPLSLAKRGAKEAVGYDVVDYAPTYELLNQILGTNAKFKRAAYDHELGTVPGAGTFDVVLSIALLVHMSDPLRHLAFLGKIARKALFVWTFTSNAEEDEMVNRYTSINRYYETARFPYCFDMTQLSPGLLRRSLEAMGFTEIHLLQPRPDGMPASCFNRHRGYLAIRPQEWAEGSFVPRPYWTADSFAIADPLPHIIETIGNYNIVLYKQRFYAFPHGLSPFGSETADLMALPGVISHAFLDELRRVVRQTIDQSVGRVVHSPHQVEAIADYNIIEYLGRYHAIPQWLGPFQVDKVDLTVMPGIISHDDLDELRVAVRKAIDERGGESQ